MFWLQVAVAQEAVLVLAVVLAVAQVALMTGLSILTQTQL
jgi:hypothetical protein